MQSLLLLNFKDASPRKQRVGMDYGCSVLSVLAAVDAVRRRSKPFYFHGRNLDYCKTTYCVYGHEVWTRAPLLAPI